MLSVPERVTKASAAGVRARRLAFARRLESAEKVCPVCRCKLSLSAFSLSRSRPDGHHGHCRRCRAARARAERAKRRAEESAERETQGKPTFALACCSGRLLDDPRIGWWLAEHAGACPDGHWQPRE